MLMRNSVGRFIISRFIKLFKFWYNYQINRQSSLRLN